MSFMDEGPKGGVVGSIRIVGQEVRPKHDEMERTLLPYIEEFLINGSLPPTLFIFHEDRHTLTCQTRYVDSNVADSEFEKKMAYWEMCTLAAVTGAHDVVLTFDMISPTEDEAIAFFVIDHEETTGAVLQYQRAEDGTFQQWHKQLGPDHVAEDHAPVIGSYMLLGAMHMMRERRKSFHSKAMIEMMRQRGHQVRVHAEPL